MKVTAINPHLAKNASETEFAYKVRRALDERIERMPEDITGRLAAARKVAVANKKTTSTAVAYQSVPQLVGVFANKISNPFDNALHWLLRIGIIIPILVLVTGSIGIYQYEDERRIDELAELDAAVLSDELPLNAYLDHGFEIYLNKHGE